MESNIIIVVLLETTEINVVMLEIAELNVIYFLSRIFNNRCVITKKIPQV